MSKFIINATNDTFVSSKNSRANYSTENYLLAGALDFGKCSCEELTISLLQFDLSNIPCHNIKSASLYVFIEDYINPGRHQEDCLFVGLAKSAYDYQTVNWWSAPKIMPTNSKLPLDCVVTGYVKIDITEIVRNWACKPQFNNGLGLIVRDNGQVVLSSSRGVKPPYIEVEADCTPIIDYNNGKSFSKRVDKAFAKVGDTLTYTIHVGNSGRVAATNVVLTDTTPEGTTVVQNSIFVNGTSIPAANLEAPGINLGTIPACSHAIVTFQVVVATIPAINPVSNSATVNYNYTEDNSVPNGASGSGNSNSTSTVINQAKLDMTKNVDKPLATVGDTLTYTVVIKNVGTTAAEHLRFFDSLSSSVSYVANSLVVNGNTIPGANPSTPPGVRIGTLLPNGVNTLTFKATVLTVPSPSIIQNFGLGYYDYTVNPAFPNASFGVDSTNIASTNVALATINSVKSASTDVATIPNAVLYTITLTNTGNTTADNLVFIDTIPEGLTFVAGSVGVNSLIQSQAVVAPPGVELGSLLPNQSVVVTFTARASIVPPVNPTQNQGTAYFNFVASTIVNGVSFSNFAPVTIVNLIP